MKKRENQIPRLLQERGWTIYRLAQEMRVQHNQIAPIVRSLSIPDRVTYKSLRAFAEAFGVTVDDLEK
jgi:transcriptional regulator with XRE-family HTH domain